MFPPLNSTVQPAAQHTPGPFAVESYGDSFEVVDEETLAITVARLSGPRAKANAERIVACLNAFEGRPFGWFGELVHIESGEVVSSSFTTHSPFEGKVLDGKFEWRSTPVAAIAKAEGSSNA